MSSAKGTDENTWARGEALARRIELGRSGLRRNDRMAKDAAASAVTAVKMPAGKGHEGALQELISNSPAVKRMLVQARERGFVSHDEINAPPPEDEISAELIEE